MSARRHGMAAIRPDGFSLIELAVALVILGLLLGSLTMPLAAQSEMRARRETETALADIRDALIGHAIAKGYLPCPAAATATTGAADAGIEARNGKNCACAGGTGIAGFAGNACSTEIVAGVLPWLTLGLPETDGWGRRYSYSIDTKFGRAPVQEEFGCSSLDTAPRFAGFALCSSATLSVKSAAAGANVASGGVPAIVISHGKNGYGAYTPQGARIAVDGASADEVENSDADSVFVGNTSIDDRSVWVPTHILMHRMLSAGKLP